MSFTVKIITLVCLFIAFCLNLVQIVLNKKQGKKNSILLLITEALFLIDFILFAILLTVHK